jgi:hypothetical protein
MKVYFYNHDMTPKEIEEADALALEIARLSERLKKLERRAASRARRRANRKPSKQDIAKLKVAMVAAHPDKGGTNSAFIEARKQYEQARAAASE